MNSLRNAHFHAAAKRYALTLPKYLQDSYGDSKYYTVPQITASVKKLGLELKYLDIAYAAYLTKSEYDQIQPGLSLQLNYEDARNEFYRHVPEPESTETWNPLTSTILGRLP